MDEYDDYFDYANGDEGIDGEGMDILEKGAYDRMNTQDAYDKKNPKDRFLYFLSNNSYLFDISDKDKDRILSKVKEEFRDLEYQNYNVDGILLGYKIYKEKPKNQSDFSRVFDKYKENINASACDIIRYWRLWKLHLSK